MDKLLFPLALPGLLQAAEGYPYGQAGAEYRLLLRELDGELTGQQVLQPPVLLCRQGGAEFSPVLL